MKRRNFLQLSGLAGIGLSLPMPSLSMATLLNASANNQHSPAFKKLTYELLKDWCDGMLKVQINQPENPQVHGALDCPACTHIHGRCMDAVYPFLYMADITGDKKYTQAAILVMDWAEQNVSQPDGSWTVIPDPKSWKGITIFGAIALAEALHYHGHVLSETRRTAWTARLAKAGQYIHDTFTIAFTNINYGGTAIYGLNLIGHLLKNDDFIAKSKKLAEEVKAYFTVNENLLFGECKKSSSKLSKKGLHGVDLGYNVEETLNSLVMYAVKEHDEELLNLLTKSLNSHLAFMLPDGAWDNSWGTRQYKWSYWGSRTCDGSQPAFAMMAHINPAFGTAAVKNTELLKQCTANGLLHGGPHYVSHGIAPCVHHTFAHAKPLAALLDHWPKLPNINTTAPLPRGVADGITHFKDLDVALFARGDWRGTVSAYDAEYHYQEDYRQATGGALGILYHQKVGLLCAASMAIYKMMEKNNQQPQPSKDIALTPRIETFKDNSWYTNLFDLTTSISSTDINGSLTLSSQVTLKNEAREPVTATAKNFALNYLCNDEQLQIQVNTKQAIKHKTAFVLPIISPTGEKVTQVNTKTITIEKPQGVVTITANMPLSIKEITRSRTFNMVPGVEALPIETFFSPQDREIIITIKVDELIT
ncbi:hypothetical protein [Thalassotalea agariperforans]